MDRVCCSCLVHILARCVHIARLRLVFKSGNAVQIFDCICLFFLKKRVLNVSCFFLNMFFAVYI